MQRHRSCLVLRGSPADTENRAEALLAVLDGEVLWLGDRASARPHLGRTVAAVVLDLHERLDADVLGMAHGMVQGGGALILRLPDGPPRDRLEARLHHLLDTHPAVAPPGPLAPPAPILGGTREQAALVDRLVATLGASEPVRVVLTADRGRGKSSALGLALAELRRQQPELRIAVTADHRASLAELERFAGAIEVREPDALLAADPLDVLVIDEAARLSVPLLRALEQRHAGARIALATTTRGYEGTGRGFSLRYLTWLRSRGTPVVEETLSEPLRWDPDDPLEDLVFRALALDAAPAPVPAGAEAAAVLLDRDALAADEGLLRGLFGLLVHAHYRTTPEDLHRLLDAPNLRVHALVADGVVVGANLVALEGELTAEVAGALAAGAYRIRGQALPETLACHLGHPEAASWRIVRSVRIVTHPDARRRGLARQLTAHVHATWRPDLFGTMFGATPGLLRFRRALGYEVVRLGVSRGSRTGEPAAVMLRAASPRAAVLVGRLRAELARDLPEQLEQLDLDSPLPLGTDLRTLLLDDLPAPAPWSDADRRAALHAWLHGPRPYDTVAGAARRTLGPLRPTLPEAHRALIEGRVFERTPWLALTEQLGLGSVPATMRALRRAVREVLGGNL